MVDIFSFVTIELKLKMHLYTANGLRVVVRVSEFPLSSLLSRVCRMLGIEK